MFLTESANNDRIHNSDVTYSMELVQEATDTWNELCDSMIALEHTAIVSENANLLQEGKKEFKEKATTLIKRVVQKFLEWIEDVRVAWSQLMAKIRTAILNPTKVQIIKNKFENAKKYGALMKKKVSIKKNALLNASKFVISVNDDVAVRIVAKFGNPNKGDHQSKLLAIADTIKNEAETEVTLDATLINASLKFLQQREKFNKALLKWKSDIKKVSEFDNSGLKSGKGTKKLAVTMYHRAINKVVLAVNSLTSHACRVLNVIKNITMTKKEKEDVKKQYKSAKATEKTAKATKNFNSKAYKEDSVLAQFSL